MTQELSEFHYVYVLRSNVTKWLYIGYTKDLSRRMSEHNLGLNNTTKKYMPLSLVYYEAYASKNDAIKREKMLKQFGSGVQKLKERIKDSIGEPSPS